ncbi:ABC transporter substrate-binding protein [Halomonas denitrificans]|nr:ABC transporter substrate-binding protein [Halomonas denitrificans]
MDRPSTRAWRKPVGVLAVWFLAAFLAACGSPEPPIRVATLPWPPYDLVHLAATLDRLDPGQVELVEFQTPAEAVRAFRYDLVDAMLVTSHFALSTAAERPDSRIVYFIDVSLGGDALLARPAIESGDELRGGRIGVEAAPLGTYTLIRALDHLAIGRDEVEIVQIDTPDQAEAFLAAEVDAVVTYEPTRSLLLAEGANSLFDSEQIPFEIIDVVVTRESVIDERSDALAELVRAFDRGLATWRERPQFTAEELARRYALDPDEIRFGLDSVALYGLAENRGIFDDPDGAVLRGLTEQCRVMLREGLLASQPSTERLLDRRIVDRALAQ